MRIFPLNPIDGQVKIKENYRPIKFDFRCRIHMHWNWNKSANNNTFTH